MHSPSYALFLLLFFSINHFSTAKTSEVSSFLNSTYLAEHCCPSQLRDCCTEAIEFFRPLNCFHHINEQFIAMKCVERAIRDRKANETTLTAENSTSNAKEFGLEDFICCNVFGWDDTDVTSQCFAFCQTIHLTPSFSTEEKLEKIEKCRRNNPLFWYYEECRAGRGRDEHGHISKSMGGRHKLIKGRKYIGKEATQYYSEKKSSPLDYSTELSVTRDIRKQHKQLPATYRLSNVLVLRSS